MPFMKRKKNTRTRRQPRPPKDCFFCTAKITPSYKDSAVLFRYITDRGKLIAKVKTGICSKHQRLLTGEIKRARYLALLPYVVRPL